MSINRPQLSLVGAVAIGLASMLGAGVFVVFAKAASLAGDWLLLAILIAGVAATLNSIAVLQLARQVDRPGGVYAYSRIYLNSNASFLAGFAFVFGKIGSIAAIALAFAAYVVPQHAPLAASIAIALMTAINLLGINRTAAVAAVLAATTASFLIYAILSSIAAPAALINPSTAAAAEPNLVEIMSAAAVVFFAFAGYARVATLGDEVKNAKRNIPIAILISLSAVLAIYLLLGIVLQQVLGDSLSQSSAVFVDYFAITQAWLPTSVVAIVAALASLGSMLALLAGVSRTAATMASDAELPAIFNLKNRRGAPWFAEAIIGLLAIGLVQVGNLVWVIGFSSFSVLFYYAIGHLTAIKQPANERIASRWIYVLGFALCAALVISIQGPAVSVSVSILVLVFFVRRQIKTAVAKRQLGN